MAAVRREAVRAGLGAALEVHHDFALGPIVDGDRMVKVLPDRDEEAAVF